MGSRTARSSSLTTGRRHVNDAQSSDRQDSRDRVAVGECVLGGEREKNKKLNWSTLSHEIYLSLPLQVTNED